MGKLSRNFTREDDVLNISRHPKVISHVKKSNDSLKGGML